MSWPLMMSGRELGLRSWMDGEQTLVLEPI